MIEIPEEQLYQDFELVEVSTDSRGDITGYVYRKPDAPVTLDETQLNQITDSNTGAVTVENFDNSNLFCVGVVLIVGVFAIFGATAITGLVRSLHGRDK